MENKLEPPDGIEELIVKVAECRGVTFEESLILIAAWARAWLSLDVKEGETIVKVASSRIAALMATKAAAQVSDAEFFDVIYDHVRIAKEFGVEVTEENKIVQ